MTSLELLANLYVALKQVYGDKVGKPLIASNVCKKYLPLPKTYEEIVHYESLYQQVFVFYVLCSHNTRDAFTESRVQLLIAYLKEKNFVYKIDQFEQFFYKHKKRNILAMKAILNLLKTGSFVNFNQLVSIPGVGVKSVSLIWNQFIESYTCPVIDVNVHKAILALAPLLKEKGNIDSLFKLMCKLDGNRCGESLAYDMSSLLYHHRKVCLAHRKLTKQTKIFICEKGLPCERCESIIQKAKLKSNHIDLRSK